MSIDRKEYIKKKIEELKNREEIKVYIHKNIHKFTPFFVDIILRNFKNKKITQLKNPNNETDIVITHITNDFKPLISNAINIVISGESDERNAVEPFDYSISTIRNFNSVYNIYVPQLFISIYEHKKSINPKDYIKEKTKFCAYLYNRTIPIRIHLFNILNKYKRVDGLGKCCNNVNIKDTRNTYNNKETYNDIALELYASYKFVLAVENRMCNGYFTEKLINPILANCIPIYYGHNSAFEYINKKRVIYVSDFNNIEKFLKYIEQVDNDPELYNKIINEPIFVNNVSIESIMTKLEHNMSEIFI